MLHILATSLSLYVIVRLILPLRLPLWLKLVLSLLVVLVALKLYFFRMAFGTMMPELPRWLTAATGVLHGSLILLIILCALRDALLLALWLARKALPHVPTLPFSNGEWASGLLALSLLLSAVAVWQALRVPDVCKLSLTLPRLPQALNGLRIVQLSDPHISSGFPRDWVQAVVDKTNALKPDLIVITGDLADGRPPGEAVISRRWRTCARRWACFPARVIMNITGATKAGWRKAASRASGLWRMPMWFWKLGAKSWCWRASPTRPPRPSASPARTCGGPWKARPETPRASCWPTGPAWWSRALRKTWIFSFPAIPTAGSYSGSTQLSAGSTTAFSREPIMRDALCCM